MKNKENNQKKNKEILIKIFQFKIFFVQEKVLFLEEDNIYVLIQLVQ